MSHDSTKPQPPPPSPDDTQRVTRDEVFRRASQLGGALHATREAIRRKSNPQMTAVKLPPKDAA